jgi:HK97 family phage major capsid protein
VTYRGAIPLSQESIDDADIDLVNLVAENNAEISLNTTNYAMSETLKKFPKKTVHGLDDIKTIYNVDLDPAYVKTIVASQSFYNFLDTVKDGNGRYMLQDSIISPSGKSFGGYPIFVIGDDLLGEAGEANAFLGDVKRGILFADRKQLSVRWVAHDLYGQYLQAVLRFDIQIADEKAGYFLTYETPEITGGDN